MRNIIMKNKKKLLDKRLLFLNIFGTNLDKYLDIVTGFDICKFDTEFLKTPDNISTKDFIRQKYVDRSGNGDDAVALIEYLIS